MRHVIVLLLLLAVPSFASAQVVINEIAWMGSDNGGTASANSNDEWIELRNMGNEAITLSGWILKSTDDKPSIILDGIIEPQGYFLLERTDDTSVPGITADLIYVGALGNTGETLVLHDNNGIEIDRVVGGEEWKNIGGDNTTKYTPQKTGSGWVTALPTPRASNANTSSREEENSASESTEQGGGSQNQSTQPTGSSTFPVEQRIYADAGEDRTVIVGADSIFEAFALGLEKKPLSNARFLWNFGNGRTAEGKKVLHYYEYPGSYVVILAVSSGEYSASDRIRVEAVSANITITAATSSFIELFNKAGRELNLSRWRLFADGSYFTIPDNTIVLSGKPLSFAASVTGLSVNNPNSVSLFYPNGVEAVRYEGDVISPVSEPSVEQTVSPSVKAVPVVVEKTVTSVQNNQDAQDSNEVTDEQFAAVAADISETDADRALYTWLAALIAIIGISVTAVLLVRRRQRHEFEIID